MDKRKSAKIYDFGTGAVVRQAPNPQPVSVSSGHSWAGRAGMGILRMVRHTLFLILLWLRGPIRILLGLIATPALIALPVLALGYSGPNKAMMIGALAGGGFIAFALRWFYDSLLIWISPEPLFMNS